MKAIRIQNQLKSVEDLGQYDLKKMFLHVIPEGKVKENEIVTLHILTEVRYRSESGLVVDFI